MINNIDQELCIGCGKCVQTCPLDTIRMGKNLKAFIAYPDDCMTCFLCERACPSGAINISPLREILPSTFPDIPVSMGGGRP